MGPVDRDEEDEDDIDDDDDDDCGDDDASLDFEPAQSLLCRVVVQVRAVADVCVWGGGGLVVMRVRASACVTEWCASQTECVRRVTD